MKKKWLIAMAAAIVAAIVLLYQWGPARHLFQEAEDRGIETGAYYYTELEQSYESEAHVRASLEQSKWNRPLPLLIAIVIAISLIVLTFWIGYKHLK